MAGPIFCRLCGVGYASMGERPRVCPGCEKPTIWAKEAYQSQAVPYRLSPNDRKWLRSVRIAAVDPDEHLGAKE